MSTVYGLQHIKGHGGKAEGAYKELVKPFIKTTSALPLFAFNLYFYSVGRHNDPHCFWSNKLKGPKLLDNGMNSVFNRGHTWPC